MSSLVDALVGQLAAIVGEHHALVDADLRAGYEVDWTGRYSGAAGCVVRPGSVGEVAAVMRCCAQAGAAVVAQGGNTGLVGGSIPRDGAVLLSLRRLIDLGDVDMAAMQVTAGAGVTVEALQHHARTSGVDFAVDWGARATATVGGAVATNAGGSRVVRFGTMRAQVAGVQVVLADGQIIDDLAGLPKETLGVHLPSLFCGSEGTLGIVTAARLRLVPWFRQRAAAWVEVATIDEAVDLLEVARTLPSLDGAEILLPEATAIACSQFGFARPHPRPGAAAVIIECAAHQDPTGDLAAALTNFDGVLGVGAQHNEMLAIRDHMTMAINADGVPLKLDVAVPVARLADLVARTRQRLSDIAPQARLIGFGHLAEGNLHLNVLDAGDQASAISDAVLGLAVELGGTVSAEHGVGIAKTQWIERIKGPAALGAMRAIKLALDPQGLLNPGVLVGR